MARRSKGEGSLYQDKNKKWIYQYYEDGKRKTKRFERKSDAQAFRNGQAPVFYASGASAREKEPARQEMGTTVGEWMWTWLETYARPTIKLSTYTSYEQYIRGHIGPLLGDIPFQSLRPSDLQSFFNERRTSGNRHKKGEGLSPKTLLNLRNMMHVSFDQAVREGLLARNYVEDVRLPKMPRQEMRVLDRQEQDRLIMAVRLSPEPAAFGVIFDLFTGLRLGELCALKWENVDMDGQTVQVRATRNRLPNFDDSIATSTSVVTHESPKTEDSRRTVPLLGELVQDFSKYQAIQMSLAQQYPGYNPEGYVFCQENGEPYEPRTFMDLFKRCLRRAGVADANFHSLRHTFATRALEQGMDVVVLAKLMGHSDPSVTLKKYAHALPDHQKSSVEKLGSLYSSGARQLEPTVDQSQQMSM